MLTALLALARVPVSPVRQRRRTDTEVHRLVHQLFFVADVLRVGDRRDFRLHDAKALAAVVHRTLAVAWYLAKPTRKLSALHVMEP